MHKKYAKDGFAAVSVSTDNLHDKDDKEIPKRVQEFLEKQQADFTNVVVLNPQEVLDKKLGILGVPCIYVFNREGRWVKKMSGDKGAEKPDYKVIEATVQELLKQK